jgi:signal peptidase II
VFRVFRGFYLPLTCGFGKGQNQLLFGGLSLKSQSVAERMSLLHWIFRTPNRRIGLLALLVVGLDQLTKWVVLQFLGYSESKVVVEGFFRFVNWSNTGAAWSLFRGNNGWLALVALGALVVLYFSRHHFNSHTWPGQLAFGLIFGGIVGNLIDRLARGHVVDFLYFYLQQRGGGEIGFPAFNVADSAICTGVGLVFLLTWKNEREAEPAQPAGAK